MEWLKNCQLEWLVQGNLTKQECIEMVDKCEESMGGKLTREDIKGLEQ